MQPRERDDLLATLKTRFDNNMRRHAGLDWPAVQARLEAHPAAQTALSAMEASGGEPDVVLLAPGAALTFCDCAPETPAGRRSLCYDGAARAARKEHKPHGSALDLAEKMGVALLDERSTARCRNWANSIPALRAGSRPRPKSAPRTGRCSATAAMGACSCTTTARSRTTRCAASGPYSMYECVRACLSCLQQRKNDINNLAILNGAVTDICG